MPKVPPRPTLTRVSIPKQVRAYYRVQVEPLGSKYTALFYEHELGQTRAKKEALKLSAIIEKIMAPVYRHHRRDPRAYIGKSGPKKRSKLPPGIRRTGQAITAHWSSAGKSLKRSFSIHKHGLTRAKNFALIARYHGLQNEERRLQKLEGVITQQLRQAFIKVDHIATVTISRPKTLARETRIKQAIKNAKKSAH